MNFAFFGGTFDPPHRGHIGIAKVAAEAFPLDTIMFAPVGNQPLKPGITMTPYEDRLAMVSLACEECGPSPLSGIGKRYTSFSASAIDQPKSDGSPNYTVNTLDLFLRKTPEAKLYCLVGADSFLSLRKWHQPDRLLSLAEWIVVSRPGYSLDNLSSLGLTEEQQGRIHLLQTAHYDISSTWLRERLAAGDSARDLLPESVARYIRDHHLYRTPSNIGE
jgi:nicotinate-nucleotide adenylyltransferase